MKRKVGAAQYTEANVAFFHKGECYSVLVSPKKTLGSVNGIQGPEPPVGPSRGRTAIDGLESLDFIQVGAQRRHETQHRLSQLGMLTLPQQVGIFLAHQGVVGEGFAEISAHNRLSPEISDRYRRAVLFSDSTPGKMRALYVLTESARFHNRLYSHLTRFFIRHGLPPSPGSASKEYWNKGSLEC
jgi:hypothetical protein